MFRSPQNSELWKQNLATLETNELKQWSACLFQDNKKSAYNHKKNVGENFNRISVLSSRDYNDFDEQVENLTLQVIQVKTQDHLDAQIIVWRILCRQDATKQA